MESVTIEVFYREEGQDSQTEADGEGREGLPFTRRNLPSGVVCIFKCVCVCVEKETCSDSKLTPRPQLLPKAVSISLEGPLFGVTHLK